MDYINIKSSETKKIAENLNELLINYQVHSQKLKAFNWNIKGRHFFELNIKFDEIYLDNIQKIDEIAKRILILGYNPTCTLKECLEHSSIKEVDKFDSEQKIINELLLDINHLLKLEKKCVESAFEINDFGTAELLSRIISYQEKLSWMFFARLQNHQLSPIN